METDFFILKPCKSTAAYEAIPKRNMNLKLDDLKPNLKLGGYNEVCDAKVMIIVEKGTEISIYPSGKLLLKTADEKVAQECAEELYRHIRNCI